MSKLPHYGLSKSFSRSLYSHYLQAKEVIIELLADNSVSPEKLSSLQDKVKELESLCSAGSNGNTQRIYDELEQKVNFDPHPQYPSLSSAIQIRYEQERGRFGIAKRDIKAGEVLVFENPTAAKIKRMHQKDHCENCLR